MKKNYYDLTQTTASAAIKDLMDQKGITVEELAELVKIPVWHLKDMLSTGNINLESLVRISKGLKVAPESLFNYEVKQFTVDNKIYTSIEKEELKKLKNTVKDLNNELDEYKKGKVLQNITGEREDYRERLSELRKRFKEQRREIYNLRQEVDQLKNGDLLKAMKDADTERYKSTVLKESVQLYSIARNLSEKFKYDPKYGLPEKWGGMQGLGNLVGVSGEEVVKHLTTGEMPLRILAKYCELLNCSIEEISRVDMPKVPFPLNLCIAVELSGEDCKNIDLLNNLKDSVNVMSYLGATKVLDDLTKKILELRYKEGMTLKDIGAGLGISSTSCGLKLKKGLRLMKVYIRQSSKR